MVSHKRDYCITNMLQLIIGVEKCFYSPHMSGMNRNTTKVIILHKIKALFRFCHMASVLHPDPTKLVGKISHLYTPSFVYGQITPRFISYSRRHFIQKFRVPPAKDAFAVCNSYKNDQT